MSKLSKKNTEDNERNLESDEVMLKPCLAPSPRVGMTVMEVPLGSEENHVIESEK